MVSFTATFTRVVAKVSVVFKAARTKAFRDEYSTMVGKTPDDYANEFIKFVTGKVTGGTEDDVLVAAITLHHKSGNCKNWSGWLQSHTTVASGLVGAAGLTKLLDDGLLVWQKKSTSPAGKFNCNVLRGVMPEYRITMDVLTNMLATADERYRMVLRSEHLCSMNVSDSVKALNKVEQMSFTINTLKGKWTSAHELMFETKSRAMVAFPNPTNIGESDVDIMTQAPLGEVELRQWIEAVAAKRQA